MPETVLDLGGLRVVAVGERASPVVVVVLHGYAMDPSDLSPFAHSLGLPAWFLFPAGPLAASPRGRAWWHVDPAGREAAIARGPRDFAEQHPPDLGNARAHLTALLDDVLDAACGRPVVLAGFSQGGMLACDTQLRAPRPVAGMALLSASRVASSEWAPFLAAGNVRGLPVLVSHGAADTDLAFSAGAALKDCLVAAGADVTWVPFDEGHQIPFVVWRRLRKFVTRAAAL